MKYSPEFEKWWSFYPKKVGKRQAFKTWEKMKVLQEIGLEELIAITRKFARSDAGRAGAFCPYPATWLSRGQWEDEPDHWSMDQRPREFKKVREYCKEEWRLPPREEHDGQSLREQLIKELRSDKFELS